MQDLSPPTAPAAPTRPATLTVAAFASIGAGAIHAVAAGAHSESSQAMWAFVALAVAQIAWGVLALRRPDRAVAAGGAVLAGAAICGWITAKTSGIAFVDGLEQAEGVQTADLLAMGLAAVALGGCLTRLASTSLLPRLAPLAVLAVVGATLPGMVAAGSHSHEGGHGGAAGEAHAHGEGDLAATDDHESMDHAPGDHESMDHAAGDHADEGHEAAVVPPAPYDPAKPLNLSGVDGVTEEEQQQAEQLISISLYHLPRWNDPMVAEADGYRSIGDGATGYEHYVNRALINDDKILDPQAPESLVYQVIDGEKTLVAAMYMLTDEHTLDDVPELGGKLTQWHIHNNLCFTPDPEAPKVGGLTNSEGECTPPLVKGSEAPMLHVWLIPHECGPFAALEGVAGGQIAEGEERWCDHAHGAS